MERNPEKKSGVHINCRRMSSRQTRNAAGKASKGGKGGKGGKGRQTPPKVARKKAPKEDKKIREG